MFITKNISTLGRASTYPLTVSYLMIGGGGGTSYGGGGGAGGYRNSYSTESSGGGGPTETPLTINSGNTLYVEIGGGGSGSYRGTAAPSKGFNTRLASLYAYGGGAGARSSADSSLNNGGSGGGEGFTDTTDTSGSYYGTAVANQGYRGGFGTDWTQNGTSRGEWLMGGGGGAGQVGLNAVWNSTCGSGGNGLSSSITGVSTSRAGGGGGTSWNSNVTLGLGGSGGGGNAVEGGTSQGGNGTPNTGSGGGASGSSTQSTADTGTGGTGGSGVVILRFPSTGIVVSYASGLAYSEGLDGSDKIVTITGGQGNITFN